MAVYVPPRRTTSTASIVTVTSETPAWLPAPGKFNTVYRADTGNTVHLASSISPDFIMADGSVQFYRGGLNSNGCFSQNTDDFNQIWTAQNGGTFNPLVGTKGSIMLFGGGHGGWCGSNVISFDIATGLWSNYTYPIYANLKKGVTGGLVSVPSGHTINPAVAPLDSDSVNSRVSDVGNYIKTMDDVSIPGAGLGTSPGPTYGSEVTNWNPMPFHTNCGAAYLPPEAGGGSLGSLIYAGHDQSNVRVTNTKSQIFRFDCATKTWSAILYGDLMGAALASTVTPALEYDSLRKIMWVFCPANSQPMYVDYKTTPPTRVKLGGNFGSISGTVMTNITYVPSRDLFVLMGASGDIAPSVSGGNDASRKRYPRLFFWKLGGNPTPLNFNAVQMLTSPGGSTTYLANMEAGTDTGWPGFRSEISGRTGGSELSSTEVTFGGSTNPAGNNNTCYMGANGVKLVDAGGIMSNVFGRTNQDTRGAADRLEYSPIDDCLIYLDVVPNNSTYLKLWKLRMPAVGNETAGTWTWEKEYIDQPDATTFAQTPATKLLPVWGGRFRYVDSLKCVVYTNLVSAGVGAVRSATWT